MDYTRLDRVRRSTTPLQLDVVEAYAQGRLSRREFMKRATVVGLGMGSITAIIAACDAAPAASSAAPAGTPGASASATGEASASAAPAGGTIRVATQRPAGPLDPVGMQDLSNYGLIAQSFEFLTALDPTTSDIGPGLATEWSPNADNSVWTFKLRTGVKWQDGSDFTAADVVATMDRLVTAGNAGLKGVIDIGSTVATDPNTATFTLVSANGNFPYLVSVFNAQTPITPASYTTGTTLDGLPNGTGPFKMTSYDRNGAKYVRNETWWGGKTALDGIEFLFFDEIGPMVTAYQGGQIDALVQFDVNSGAALFDDPAFSVNEAITTTHRQIWMRVDKGQFVDKKVRQALALTLDREAMIQQLFKGKGKVANDHVIFELYPYFDPTIPQRTRNIEMAKQLLADAGATGLKADLHFAAAYLEISDLAALMIANAKDAGIELAPAGESLDTFYGAQWCPAEPADPPCSGASEIGIVDYGHRSTPDVFLNSALKTKGVWNSSQYASPVFDSAFAEFQSAVGVDAQKAACTKIETVLNDEVPIAIPYIYSFLSGNAKTFQGVYSSALGQMFFDKASKV
ncbi:MAG: ABC transporter substrate-binding protein [Candidatus Limnocylindrales bacterium]